MKVSIQKTKLWLKSLFIFFALLTLWALFHKKSNAIEKLPSAVQIGTEEGELVFPPLCEEGIQLLFNLQASGFMVPGIRVDIEVLNPRYVATIAQINGDCDIVVGKFEGPFIWSIIKKPQGSNVSLQDISSLNPYFVPDIGGEYIINFEACPEFCQFPLPKGLSVLLAGANQ